MRQLLVPTFLITPPPPMVKNRASRERLQNEPLQVHWKQRSIKAGAFQFGEGTEGLNATANLATPNLCT